MSHQSFNNELARALARPDVDELKSVLAAYHHWSSNNLSEKDWVDELDVWFAAERDPDLGLALVSLAAASYDEPDFRALVAAGLLENLLQGRNRPSEQFLQRILDEARKTARFRWMLSGVYRTGIISDQAAAIKRVVGHLSMEEPLPPRPCA